MIGPDGKVVFHKTSTSKKAVDEMLVTILSLMVTNHDENIEKGISPKTGDYSLGFLVNRLSIHADNIFDAMRRLQNMSFVTEVRPNAWSFITENVEKAKKYIDNHRESAKLPGENEESNCIATAGMLVKDHFISSKQADEIFTYFGRILLNDKMRKELEMEDPVSPTTIELNLVFRIDSDLTLTYGEMLQLLKEIGNR